MKTTVILDFDMEGFHWWSDAPDQVAFLRQSHRHLFRFRVGLRVAASNREREIFLEQWHLQDRLNREFAMLRGDSRGPVLGFNGMSCEQIAEWVLNNTDGAVWCEVLEDGRGGARVEV